MHHPPVEELELIDSPAALEWARVVAGYAGEVEQRCTPAQYS
ncbi:hypothetical protein CIP107525_00346 [Corynebacterium diphtheriae]|nr:hypothetical protein CIP107525_00346 [Corynebacterium diphtheriae]